jgi:hypothetical protein
LKLTKYRRLVATVGLVGAGAMALLTGPALAHNQNGNPDPTNPADPVNGRHDVTISKAVSLIRSKADGCAFNTAPYGPACATPSTVDVSAPAFNGTPNQGVTVILCNAKRAAPTDQGGDNDPTGGCDIANARGLSSVPSFPASSGTFLLDGSGNFPGTVTLTLTSCNGATGSGTPDLLTQFGGPDCVNGNATTTCPPTQGQIANGWSCIVPLAEFDPNALTAGAHVGYRTVNMKSPIPAKLCNNVACGATIPAGTAVKLTGVRFPCKVELPDDPGTAGAQGACITAQTGKTILMKRSSTGLLEGGAITPTSQTAGVNGDYTVTFTMPTLLHPGELYKIVPHAQDCVFNQGNAGFAAPNNWMVKSCESGKFNAAGVTFKQ